MFRLLVKKLQKLNWSIRSKLALAFGLVLVCFIVNGIISVVLLFNIKTTEEQQRTTAIHLEQVQGFDLEYAAELELYSNAIFFSRSRSINDSFTTLITLAIKEQSKSDRQDAQQEFIANFAKSYNLVFAHFQELTNYISQDNLDKARANWQRYSADFDLVKKILETRVQQLQLDRGQGEEALGQTIFVSTTVIISLTSFSILLALGLLLLIERVLVRPLNQLQEGLHKVAEGNLDQQIEIYNRDEVGKLALSFRQALFALQRVINGVQIGESLRQMTGQLTSVSQQQLAGSTEQVTALTHVTAAMEELGSTAIQIAEEAQEVNNLIDTTLEQMSVVTEASRGSQERTQQMVSVVENTLNSVERVGQQIDSFQKQMNILNEQASAIGKVVGLLGSITSEVHLLSLNAAIEAAGAGQYGDRFRAVAHHVKQLASRSNLATEEARVLVEGVQTSSRLALEQIEEGLVEMAAIIQANSGLRGSLQELEYSAQKVGEAVSYLLTMARQVSQRAVEIRHATHQQRISSEQVIVSTRSVGEVAEQTASTTQLLATSSVQLDNLTNQLSRVLSQVKLAA